MKRHNVPKPTIYLKFFNFITGAAFAALLLLNGCTGTGSVDWTDLIPKKSSFIIIPQQGDTISDLLEKPWSPMFEDLTPSTIQAISEMQQEPGVSSRVAAIVIYPETSNDSYPVWITETPAGLYDLLTENYQREFAQNSYTFRGNRIDRLFLQDRTFFVTQMGSYTLFSESSLGIEESIRSYNDTDDRLVLTDDQLQPGSLVINTPDLDSWLRQISLVTYHPYLTNLLDGSSPLALQSEPNGSDEIDWVLTGTFTPGNNPSLMTRGISGPPAALNLDRFIPADAAAFAILQLPPRTVPPADSTATSELDSHLMDSPDRYSRIANALGNETAFAAFAETGVMSASEFLLLRSLTNRRVVEAELEALFERGLVERTGSLYQIRSAWLGQLFGAEYSPLTDFYLGIYDNTIITSRSRVLVESVEADRALRQVAFYDDHYIAVREQLPSQLSALLYLDSSRFNSYIQPWLSPQNTLGVVQSDLDLFVMGSYRSSADGPVTVEMLNYLREIEDVPYSDQWTFQMGSAEVSGPPILANIGGNPRDEIIFSTRSGSVFALVGDGTVFAQMSTGSDVPVGSPVVYDWYGNNQNVIMQAAGNKIYAWNEVGSTLPNFPVTLPEQITTPLMVSDITRNGIAEMIVATADRNLHILNRLGTPITGWPQITNSVITGKPLITEWGGQLSIFAFSETVFHGWNINGRLLNGFPVFTEARFNGSPVRFGDHLLGSGSDGRLRAIGLTPLFADSLASDISGDSLYVQSLNIAGNSLNVSPSTQNLMIRVDEELVREDLIILQSASGAVFLVNGNGELRFTQSMGQSGSESFSPVITDINNNDRQNVTALATLGRLYSWDLISGERVFDIPTTGLTYPVIDDLNGDGYVELIGHTQEGLRVWTIYR